MVRKNAILIILLTVFLIFAAGCTQSDMGASATVPEGSTDDTSVTGGATPSVAPVVTETPVAVSNPFPDALNIGQRWYYDSETGKSYDKKSSDSDLCIQAEGYKEIQNYYLYNTKTGDKICVHPASGNKFYLVSVTATVVGGYGTHVYTPYPEKLPVISGGATYQPMKVISDEWGVEIRDYSSGDGLYLSHDAELSETYVMKNVGDIYVRTDLYKAGKEKELFNAWVMYEVPESFNKADAYFRAELGDSSPVWKMHDLLAEVMVDKSPYGGIITVTYAGGPDSSVVNDVDVFVTKADGTLIKEKISPVIGESVEIKGSKEEDDHITVTVNSYSGEGFKKYDGYL